MTTKEAQKVLKMLASADGGCDVCVSRLFAYFLHLWPEHRGMAQKAWAKIFKYDFDARMARYKDYSYTEEDPD